MTNRSDRGSNKPRGAERFERDDVIRDPIRGLHQGQQPCGAAQTGRTHGCTRPVLIAAQTLLHRGGRPHMAQRPHHRTAKPMQGPSTTSRQSAALSECCLNSARGSTSAPIHTTGVKPQLFSPTISPLAGSFSSSPASSLPPHRHPSAWRGHQHRRCRLNRTHRTRLHGSPTPDICPPAEYSEAVCWRGSNR